MRVLACLLMAAMLVGCGSGEAEPQAESTKVKVLVAEIAPAAGSEWTLSGTVQSQNEAALSFRLQGEISERLVQAGQQVKANDVLLRLDPSDTRQQLAAAQANLAAARVQAENAEANRRRLSILRDQQLVPQQAYEDAEAQARATQQAAKAAEAAVAQASSAVGYLELRAPASGVLLEVSGEVGQVVAPGVSVALLAYDGARDVEVFVPERRRAHLPERAQVQAFASDRVSPVQLREVAGSADPLTRSWRARFAIDGEPEAWPLGTSVTLLFNDDEHAGDNGLQRIPLGSLIDQGQGMGVWVVADGQVVREPVELVRMNTEYVYIRSEIPTGTPIIALGAHMLVEGQAVEVLQ